MMTTKQLKAIKRRKKYLRVKHTNKNLPKRLRQQQFQSSNVCNIIQKAGYLVLQQHTPLRFKS